jgi:tetratricopeptide (TPR) repeat protein
MGRWAVRLLAFFAALVLILQLVGVAALARYREQVGQTFALPEAPASPNRNVEVVHIDAPNDVEAAAFQDMLDGLGKALNAEDGAEAARHFDHERMLEEMTRTGVRKPPTAKDRPVILRTVHQGVERSLLASPIRWHAAHIRSARFLDAERTDAVLFVRHDGGLGGSHKVRWWIHHGPTGWRFYDVEDLHLGLRLSLLTGQITQANRGRERDTLLRLEHAAWALKAKNVEEAERIITRFEAEPLSPAGQTYRWTLKAHLALGQAQPAEALTCINRAEAIQPHPLADLVRATARNQLGEHEAALEAARKAITVCGDDADVDRQIGIALDSLGRGEEAIEAYRAGLKEDPGVLENLMSLRAMLPAGQKAELGEWLPKLPQPQVAFRPLASEALNAGDHESVDVLVEAVRKIAPQLPAADVVKARQSVRRKKVNIGIAQFKAAIVRIPVPERSLHVRDFLDDMLAAGKPLEAYRAAPDPAFAFRYLADKLEGKADRADELRRLTEEHKKRQPPEE